VIVMSVALVKIEKSDVVELKVHIRPEAIIGGRRDEAQERVLVGEVECELENLLLVGLATEHHVEQQTYALEILAQAQELLERYVLGETRLLALGLGALMFGFELEEESRDQRAAAHQTPAQPVAPDGLEGGAREAELVLHGGLDGLGGAQEENVGLALEAVLLVQAALLGVREAVGVEQHAALLLSGVDRHVVLGTSRAHGMEGLVAVLNLALDAHSLVALLANATLERASLGANGAHARDGLDGIRVSETGLGRPERTEHVRPLAFACLFQCSTAF